MAAKNLERGASIDDQTALRNYRKCRLKHIQRHQNFIGSRMYFFPVAGSVWLKSYQSFWIF